MGFFNTKKEVDIEGICTDFYEYLISGQKIEELSKETRETIVKIDNAFAVVDLNKLTHELTIICFEFFALAWAHHSEDNLVSQSLFTHKYLSENGKDDIWDGMKSYNRAVQSSDTYGLSDTKYAQSLTEGASFCDKQKKILQENGITLSESALESVYRSNWRRKSKKAWEGGATIFGINLALCERLGLAEGDNSKHFGLFGFDNSNINFGINDEARLRLSAFINWLYDEAKQFLDNKI